MARPRAAWPAAVGSKRGVSDPKMGGSSVFGVGNQQEKRFLLGGGLKKRSHPNDFKEIRSKTSSIWDGCILCKFRVD